MIPRLIFSMMIGAGIGAVTGHFGKCSSGGCPLTSTPLRGASYGAFLGLLFGLSMGGASGPIKPGSDVPAAHIQTKKEFKLRVLESPQPCLVDFFSTRCPPCRALSPTIDVLSKTYQGRAGIYKVNVAEAPELAGEYEIRSIPAVLFFANGKVEERVIGRRGEKAYSKILDRLLGEMEKKKTGTGTPKAEQKTPTVPDPSQK